MCPEHRWRSFFNKLWPILRIFPRTCEPPSPRESFKGWDLFADSTGLRLTPPWIVGKIEVKFKLFPIKNAVGQDTRSQQMDHRFSMHIQAVIEGFQMPQGS